MDIIQVEWNTGSNSPVITVNVYYSFDEETGYRLDYDGILEEFQQALDEVEDNISHLNHERDEHLRTKHMEFPERETDGAEL